jgi:indole-3-glycerol phosphate synthase
VTLPTCSSHPSEDTDVTVPDVLARQLDDARSRVATARAQEPLESLRERALAVPPGPSLLRALQGEGVAVIAEVKRASPSRGPLADIADPVAMATDYLAGGAAAISVLTAPVGFRGSLTDLAEVAQLGQPTLRKDFLLDEYQIWEARAVGASAVLLLAIALDDATLAHLDEVAQEAGLDVLLEVHDAAEMRRAARLSPAIVGINVRDLRDFRVDPERFGPLASLAPSNSLLVAESGVDGPEAVRRYVAAGADAILVGEHLVTSTDPRAAVADLLAAGGMSDRPTGVRA